MSIHSKKLHLIRQVLQLNDEALINELITLVKNKTPLPIATSIQPHFDQEENKVIVRRNQTDLDIVEELVAYGLAEEDIQLAFRREEAHQVADRLKMVEHLKGILPDVPYDKNDFYHQ